MSEVENCPICNHPLERCQCAYFGSSHPDRTKRMEVVLEHLYLFSRQQINHILSLEERYQISYGDPERQVILRELKEEYSKEE